jgi:hypothetical protein
MRSLSLRARSRNEGSTTKPSGSEPNSTRTGPGSDEAGVEEPPLFRGRLDSSSR